MRLCRLVSLLAAGAIVLIAPEAGAQVVLSQSSFEAGSKFAAFFKIAQGCDGSPTTSLRVQIPDDVTVVELPPKDGWTVNPERVNNRITAVNWRGRLEAGQPDQFGVLLQLPAHTGALYFPAVQRCAKGEMRWTATPVAGQPATAAAKAAPSLELTQGPPRQPMFMAGDIMVVEPWSRATPPGARTGAGYMTVMNHGAVSDVLTGGSTPAADMLEIHQMSMAGGIMSMRPVPGGVPIPRGATVSINPDGGYHLMLAGLKAPLKVGTHIPVTLNFEKAGAVQVEFTVEALGALGPTSHDSK